MSDKYYIPDISEFHVGFEFEYTKDDGTLIKSTDFNFSFYNDDTDTVTEVEGKIKEKSIRVKYLDREDIEECGFNETSNEDMADNNGYLFTKEDKDFITAWIELRFWTNSKRVQIKKIDGIVFDGIIKNKSEFKRILKQVGITK